MSAKYLGISIIPGYRQQSQQVIRKVSVQDLGGKVSRWEKDISVGEGKLQRLWMDDSLWLRSGDYNLRNISQKEIANKTPKDRQHGVIACPRQQM